MPEYEQAPIVPGRESKTSRDDDAFDGLETLPINFQGRVKSGYENTAPAYTRDAEGGLVMNTNFPEAPAGYRSRHNRMGGIMRLLTRR